MPAGNPDAYSLPDESEGTDDEMEAEQAAREARAEELGTAIEAKDWMALLELIEGGGMGLMIGIGGPPDEDV